MIGRRFDPQLLAAVAEDAGDIEARLAGDARTRPRPSREQVGRLFLQARSGARRALSEPADRTARRAASENCRGNRTPKRQSTAEVVETLAHHYSQTDREQSVRLSGTGRREEPRRVFLDEADKYFAAAITLLDAHAKSAQADSKSPSSSLAMRRFSHLMMRLTATRKTVEAFYRDDFNRLPDHPELHVDPTPFMYWSCSRRVGIGKPNRRQRRLSAVG